MVGKLERTRPRGIPRNRLEDNIRTDFREIGWEVVDWILLAQDRDQWQVL
jgi:hypothetical protein